MREQRIIRLRETLLADLTEAKEAFARSLAPESATNTFVWYGAEFWVDRVRRIIIPASEIANVQERAWTSQTTLPGEDSEASSSLEAYGGEQQLWDVGSLMKMWARLLRGVERRYLWIVDSAQMLNLAVAQPSINPAFNSLLWLALADDMGPVGDYRDNFFDLVGSMVFAQINLPRLTPDPEDVRNAQILFLERLFPGTTDASCARLSDSEWAARCEEQLRQHQQLVDDRFFDPLLERVDALAEPSTRRFE